ncbi:MAG TPA: DUF2723 domain-containing protein [Pontiella sp.]
MNSEKFFRKSDWIACWTTFVISLIVYTITLQPTLGLEDSGELIVASDYLGVPHPPGYPIWSLLTWFFQWIFHGVTFHGQPNPAWGVNFFSAFSGAAACGVIALLISRSGMDLLNSLKKETAILGEKTERLFCSTAGISGGLLLAFGQGMWSQAVIAEVYTLNIFFQSLMLIFLYRWLSQPKQTQWLMLCAFVFGLGITNHQTLMFMGLAIAVAVLFNELEIFSKDNVWFLSAAFFMLILAAAGIYKNSLTLQFFGIFGCIISCLLIKKPYLVRDFVIVGVLYVLLVGFNKWATETTGMEKYMWISGPEKPGFWIWTFYVLIIPTIAFFTLPNGKIVGPTFLLMFIGLGFYLYMPISSDQNPPINWGYPRTWKGFMHAVTRGQYARVKLASVLTPQFLNQVLTYFRDLRSQFYWPIALLAGVPVFFSWKTGKRNIGWLVTTLVAFLSVGIVFMILQNPKTDIQSLFIGRVQYIQSHAIYVIWIGYGILFLMAYLETLVKNNPITKVLGVAMVLLLPLALIYKNYNDKPQLKVYGGAEQTRHDFGWQFGNWQLRGVEGIKSDMEYWYGKGSDEFEHQWAAYPNKNYPEPMDTNAIFFGGTDPGRFVPTYMIYSAKVRPDIYLITQNALADNTYMDVMRDLYGDQIWIPSLIDNNRAFEMFVNGVKSGRIKSQGAVTTEKGKIQVQGVEDVMTINGFLSKMIFDHNQYRTETKTDEQTRQAGSAVVYDDPVIDPQTGLPPTRSFYVEESYVLQWMYPYLTPHGLIMKINNKPTPITQEMIKNDTDFWDWNCERLINDQRFIRDVVARKTFSKLRSALAGLYAYRGNLKEAEYAFQQAIDLYDLSPEANFRLADMLSRQNRYDEALEILKTFLENDPNNEKAVNFNQTLKNRKEMTARRIELEAQFRARTIEFPEILELMEIQCQMGQQQQAESLARNMLNSNTLDPEMMLAIAQFMTKHRSLATVELAFRKYTVANPNDPRGWVELAALQIAKNKRGESFVFLRKAIEKGGDPIRQLIRKDPRFRAIHNTPEYNQLVPQPVARGNLGLSPLPTGL